MAKSSSESSDDFEFIETPAAPTPVPPAEDCGVRTTSVSDQLTTKSICNTNRTTVSSC